MTVKRGPFATRGRTGMVLLSAVAVLASAMTLGQGASADGTAAEYAKALNLSVTASFAGSSRSDGLIAGTVGQASPFTLTPVCTTSAAAACDANIKFTWDVPGANVSAGSGNSVSAWFAAPGVYTATVRANGTIGATNPNSGSEYDNGSATVSIVVSPTLADVNAGTAGAQAMWSAVGSNLLGPCRTYAGATTGSAEATKYGQVEFCPEPDGERTLQSLTGSPTVLPESFPGNGVTLTACSSEPQGCGVKPTWIPPMLDSSSNSVGCTASPEICEGAVSTTKSVNIRQLRPYMSTLASGNLACVDNVRARLRKSSAVDATDTLRGVEPGCATVGDLIRALGGIYPTTADSPAKAKSKTIANKAVNPDATNATGWNFPTTGTATASVISGSGFGDSSLVSVPNSPTGSIDVEALGSNGVKGQTYTASVYVKAATAPVTVNLSMISADGAGGWLSDVAVNSTSTRKNTAQTVVASSTVTVPSTSWTRVWVTGLNLSPASGENMKLRLRIPANSGTVLVDAASFTTTNQPIAYSATSTPSWCAAGAQPDQTIFNVVSMFPALSYCDTDAALTKAQAANIIGSTLGVFPSPADVAAVQKEFADSGADSAEDWASLFVRGVPIVGDLRCPNVSYNAENNSDPRACLNGNAALSRAELAQMLTPLLLTSTSSASSTTVKLTPTTASVGASAGVSVSVWVSVPAWVPAGSRVVLEPTTSTGPGGAFDCPVTRLTISEAHTAQSVCTGTSGTTSGTWTAGVKAISEYVSPTGLSSGQGNASQAFTVTASAGPEVPAVFLPTVEKSSVSSSFALAVDVNGEPVEVGVRSCDPGYDSDCSGGAATFPQTGKSRTYGGSSGATSDNAPAKFLESAETEIGTISITSVVGGRVNLKVSPFDTFTNGYWSFVLQACDTARVCTARTITNYRTPVADEPVAKNVTANTTVSTPVVFSLASGVADTYDSSPYDGTPATLFSAKLASATPTGTNCGTLQVDPAGGTAWTAISATTFYNTDLAKFRWSPTATATTCTVSFTGKERDATPPLTSLNSAILTLKSS